MQEKQLSQQEWTQEVEYLEAVKSEIDTQLISIQQEVDNRRGEVQGTRKWMWEDAAKDTSKLENAIDIIQHGLELYRQEKTYLFSKHLEQKLLKLMKKPYFGRMDFVEQGEKNKDVVYVGLSTLKDDQNNLLIYDWRAPISSMYYDYELGLAGYTCQEGEITGDILLKRQYKIKEGQLLSFFDSTIHLGDEVLKDILSQYSSSEKMKSIVTTIQKEQNEVIRQDSSDVLVVQGAAGSGKTSIALQRIAYLLYKYRESIHSDNIIIFSPNQVFNDYIRDVLPELGEENMHQTTFQDYIDKMLTLDIEREDQYEQLERLYHATETEKASYRSSIEVKSSKAFVEFINIWIERLSIQEMSFEDIAYKSYKIMTKEELAEMFYSTYRLMALPHRLERIHEEIQSRFRQFELAFEKKIKKKIESRTDYFGTEEEEVKYSKAVRKKRLAALKQSIELWIDQLAWQHFQKLFTNKQHDIRGLSPDISCWEDIALNTLSNLQENKLFYEDVVPFIYLLSRFKGIVAYRQIFHVVIDEVQDYTPFHFELFQQLFPNARYTMLGDINQAIRAFGKWNSYSFIKEIFSTRQVQLKQLNKSYRSTYEIGRFAAEILPQQSIEFVDRHGDKPQIAISDNETRLMELLLRRVENECETIQSVAVITKTAAEAQRLYEYIKPHLKVKLIRKDDSRYAKGIIILPAYLAKGLEFDHVHAWNISIHNFAMEEERELLYTICTRAQHKLLLYVHKLISPLLKKVDNTRYTIENMID